MRAGFPTRFAVALSNITIVGGTLANFAFNCGRAHPLRPGPLIDWWVGRLALSSCRPGSAAGLTCWPKQPALYG